MGLWLSLGLIVVLVGGIFLSVRDRNLATIESVEDSLLITPRGFNKVWAFRSRLEVPLADVVSIRVIDPTELRWGWRMPGTAFPGLIHAGTFIREGERSFYLFRGGRPILMVELTNNRFSRIAIETADPNGVATKLNRVQELRT